MRWWLVGLGGAIGALMRHGVSQLLSQRPLTFPLAILVVNVVGSIAIGLLAGALSARRFDLSIEAQTFLFVGVLGGFTTFSSFSLDTLVLFRTGHAGLALFNVAGQICLSLAGVWLGYRLGSMT